MSYKVAFALLPLLPLLGGCSSDECTRADDLVAACAPPTQPPPVNDQSMTLACSGARLCHARCINAASCLEINALQCYSAVSCPPVPKNSVAAGLAKCLAACSSGIDGGAGGSGTGGSGGTGGGGTDGGP